VDHLREFIRDVPDFPSPGILFKDLTPLLRVPSAMVEVVQAIAGPHRGGGIDIVVAIESRGFLFGAPVAMELDAGFVPIRKPGKLPAETIWKEYALEYGSGQLEIHRDAVTPGQRVLVIDDVLATGGTARAAAELVEELGGEVAALAFVLELGFLDGRAKLEGRAVTSLLKY
jgi:adenine phosphoribosyltransferase